MTSLPHICHFWGILVYILFQKIVKLSLVDNNQSINMYKIAFFGDSYVRRLRDSPFADLQLNNFVVQYYTQGGMSLKDVPTHPAFRAMKRWRPREVFIHIGGNDISYQTNPYDLAHQMEKIVYSIPAERVLVGEIPPRGTVKPWVGLSVSEFNDFRTTLNNCLFERFGRDCVPFFLHGVFRPDGSQSPFIHGT